MHLSRSAVNSFWAGGRGLSEQHASVRAAKANTAACFGVLPCRKPAIPHQQLFLSKRAILHPKLFMSRLTKVRVSALSRRTCSEERGSTLLTMRRNQTH
jgi:hypothetical protein